ncbi:MAG TPA: ATPase, T2SS/T4P/T4SS family [Candidatus Polarisedimenticolia bacterium]|nr:ATPase, T2SS/T4P/T4SS family [Candidatus Polarisedimenticolia bacterium]
MSEDPLARILVERQLLPPVDTAELLRRARSENRFLEDLLTQEKLFTRAQLLEILENHYFCPSIDVRRQPFDVAVLRLVPRRLAERHLILPVSTDDESVKIAHSDPDDSRARDAIAPFLRRPVVKMVALRTDLRETIERHYSRLARELGTADGRRATPRIAAEGAATGPVSQTEAGAKDLLVNLDPGDPVALVTRVIEEAERSGATDIHLEQREEDLTIRFRLDGILKTMARLPKEIGAVVTSRLKVMGQMDISERRVPQDGRHTVRRGETLLDLRLSSLPSQFGEKIVIRLLRKNTSLLNLDNLKMPPAVRKLHEEMIKSPMGFFLVTGPTGSGKTTTLYSTLMSLDLETTNIVTLENPIEYSIKGITQVQIQEAAGLTFASGLESILRQDPNVILVGEIRDGKTVEIACRAALTGHKVFSTLHTNDACQAITRLLDMGCLPYLITATVRGVLAQRLVRVICESCVEGYEASESEITILGYPETRTLHRGAGCARCHGTGYFGRRAVFEYLRLEDNLHRLILERASPYAIRQAAQRNGMILMSEFAKKAVLAGTTTVAEVQRVLLSDEGREQLCRKCQRVVSLDFAVCPYCQQVLKENCGQCRKTIEPGWEVCPSCGHDIERTWERIYCRRCMAPLEQEGGACPYCGGEDR